MITLWWFVSICCARQIWNCWRLKYFRMNFLSLEGLCFVTIFHTVRILWMQSKINTTSVACGRCVTMLLLLSVLLRGSHLCSFNYNIHPMSF
jgi:hypothetical protein